MEPLLVFSKGTITERSNTTSEIDVLATPSSNLMHIGATLGEIIIFFRNNNLFSDDSIAGGASTKAADFTRVALRVRAGNETDTIERFHQTVKNAQGTGQILQFKNELKKYDVKGILEVVSITRTDLPNDDDVYLSCGTGGSSTDIDPGVVDVANDSFLFYDSDDEGLPKVETISDFVESIAGDNITATNGVLSVEDPNNSLIDEIVVTNLSPDIGNAQGPKTYAAGTSLEDIIRDILTDYYVTSVTLSGLKIQLETTTEDTFGTEYTSTSGTTDVEVGRAVKVNGFTYSVADPTQTINDSVKFYRANNIEETGFLDTNTAATLATTIQNEYHTETTIPYKLSAVDNGGDSSVVIYSGTRNIRWLFRAKVGALDTSAVGSNSEAQTLYDNLVTTDAFDNLTTKQDINTQGTSYTYTQGYYTWVIFPAAWTIDNIVQAGQPVLSDFTYEGDFDIDNGYTDSANKISYSFYVSVYERAFLDGENITVSFL